MQWWVKKIFKFWTSLTGVPYQFANFSYQHMSLYFFERLGVKKKHCYRPKLTECDENIIY
jgi:hypothetical protein